jgi:hypothetical protein
MCKEQKGTRDEMEGVEWEKCGGVREYRHEEQ